VVRDLSAQTRSDGHHFNGDKRAVEHWRKVT
jgi:hypothetical protein